MFGTGPIKSRGEGQECFTTSPIHQNCLQAATFISVPQKNDDYCRDGSSLEPVTEDACSTEAIHEQESQEDLESRDTLFGLQGAAFDASQDDDHTDTLKPKVVVRRPFLHSPAFGSSFEDDHADDSMRLNPSATLAQAITRMCIRGSGTSVRHKLRKIFLCAHARNCVHIRMYAHARNCVRVRMYVSVFQTGNSPGLHAVCCVYVCVNV